MKLISLFFYIQIFLLLTAGYATGQDKVLRKEAIAAMKKATIYFRNNVSTHGGYLFRYSEDFSLREGEEVATPTMIWIEPPGTPEVGMRYLEAYEATEDTLFLNGAIEACRALAWGQLESGGWDHRIEFDPEASKKWYYRRDIESGDLQKGRRRNSSSLDDDVSQSSLRLLMRTDKVLSFKNKEIHHAAMYCLESILKVQYPNGAWPQWFTEPPDPKLFPVKKAQYPAGWSRVFPGESYSDFYTFNDNSMADVVTTMIEAYGIYGDEKYINAAKKCGDFIIMAQMPEPQPAWAQQYNINMEPSWARKFEPPSVSGYESFGAMNTLLELYLNTGDKKYLEPIPKALKWAKSSLLPDGRLARFYELHTNKPLYFDRSYTLMYEDHDMPTHYSFKVPADALYRVESLYSRILSSDRKSILADREKLSGSNPADVVEVINNLDDKGRWIEKGSMRAGKERIETNVITCATFNRNMSTLTNFVRTNN